MISLKRILIILLILLISSTVSAKEGTNFKVGDYFSLDFPRDWKVIDCTSTPPLIDAQSPNRLTTIIIAAYPIVLVNIDDLTKDIQSVLNNQGKYIFQDQGKLKIDNREARWLLYSIEEPNHEKEYWLLYVAYSKQYRYHAITTGFYKDLETDNRDISSIVSSMRILK